MSSSSERGPGRPPGISEATLEKQRRVRRAAEMGIPIAQIASMEECEPAYVRMLINGAKKKDESPEPASSIEPPQPRRLSRRTAQVRAWEHAEQHVISKLGLAVDAFWVRIVVAIHQEGDGYRLHIGEPGCRFRSRDDLVDLFGRREVEIKDWVAALVERGRLIEVGAVDIGIPHGMKLTPAENIRAKPGAKRAAQPSNHGQVTMLHVVPADIPDATEIPPQTQIKTQLNLHPVATEIPENANLIPTEIPPVADEQAAAAAANAKDICDLTAAAATVPPAHDANNIRIKFASDATGIPPTSLPGATEINLQRSALAAPSDATEINLQRSALATLTASLMKRAKIDRVANADDLGAVQGWLDAKTPIDMMEAVIESLMERRKGDPPTSLKYFDKPMRKAMAAACQPATFATPQAVKPPVAAPPRSAAAEALDARLLALARRHAESKLGPDTPTRAGFDAACRLGKPADGLRWITALEDVWRAELIDAAELPAFQDYMSRPNRYADEMAEIDVACGSPQHRASG